jgi:hypothetical protein
VQKAEQLDMMQKILGMTGRQRQTMRARPENLRYPPRQQVRAAARPEMLLSRRAEPEIAVEAQGPRTTPSSESSSSLEVAVRQSNTTLSCLGELALHISTVTARDLDSIFAPSSRPTASARPLSKAQEPTLTLQWLHDKIFSNSSVESESMSGDAASAAVFVTEAPVSVSKAQESALPQLKRKDAKQAKKQRTMESRALARTMTEDMAAREAEEKELAKGIMAQKALARKTGGRRGTTPFIRLGR